MSEGIQDIQTVTLRIQPMHAVREPYTGRIMDMWALYEENGGHVLAYCPTMLVAEHILKVLIASQAMSGLEDES